LRENLLAKKPGFRIFDIPTSYETISFCLAALLPIKSLQPLNSDT